MSAVADKLREARALIERGWVQGMSRVKRGQVMSYCAVGALGAVGAPAIGRHYLKDATRLPNTIRISEWNDAPERTQAEVLAAFDKAIELAERDQ